MHDQPTLPLGHYAKVQALLKENPVPRLPQRGSNTQMQQAHEQYKKNIRDNTRILAPSQMIETRTGELGSGFLQYYSSIFEKPTSHSSQTVVEGLPLSPSQQKISNREVPEKNLPLTTVGFGL